MTNNCPVENVSNDNSVSIDFNCLNNDDAIPVPTTTDSFKDELPSVANSSTNAAPTVASSSIKLKMVSDVLLSSLSPQTESSVTKTSESSSKTSKPAVACIDGHFSHYTKWEQKFQWAYYSLLKEGWLCKTCEEFCDSGDQYWKTKDVKHEEHPKEMLSRHQEIAKHIDTNKTKHSVLKFIHKKGNIKDQLKLVSAIFYQMFNIHQMIALQKL